jgi:hypothetical protein
MIRRYKLKREKANGADAVNPSLFSDIASRHSHTNLIFSG